MTSQFLQRIRKDIQINLEAIRELVLALAERVNRRVQVLRLHWQAAEVTDELAALQQDLGASLCDLLQSAGGRGPRDGDLAEARALLAQTATRVRLLKQDIARMDALVSELERETVVEVLHEIQRDLSLRSAAIERVVVGREAEVIGRAAKDLGLPSTARVVALFRGPTLMIPDNDFTFRAGDIVVLLGLRADLKAVLPSFLGRQRVSA